MQASVDAGFCFCAVDVDVCVGFSCVVQPIFIELNWSPVHMCEVFQALQCLTMMQQLVWPV